MTTYYVDSNATGGTNAGTSWTNAYLSFWNIPSTTLADTDIVYVASNHVDADPGAAKTLTGPSTANTLAKVISVTSGTTTYAAGAQIKTTGGSYALRIDNAINFYGITFVSGANVDYRPGTSALQQFYSCTFKLGNGSSLLNGGSSGPAYFYNCTYDYSADTSNSGNSVIGGRGPIYIYGGTYVKATSYNRTGVIIDGGSAAPRPAVVSGLDLSVIGSTNDLTNMSYAEAWFINCKLPSTWSIKSADGTLPTSLVTVYNSDDNTDDPRFYMRSDRNANLTMTTSVYRSSGASIEGSANFSWQVVTLAVCSESRPFMTEWMNGTVSSTGSKTFSVAVANNTETLHDDDIWLEVEYMGDASTPKYTLGSDQRTNGSANTGASTTAQTTDGTSSWTGTLSTLQTLDVTVTVNQAGLYRARVCVGKPSLTVYIDPKVTVS
jgi:hypothetical protein